MTLQDEYLETRVMTATPAQLHLMVIDGAVRFAASADESLSEGDFEAAHFSLNRAREFVTELIGGLNEEHASELTEQLKALFAFVFRNLVEADMERNAAKVRDALKILRMHRESWTAMLTQFNSESAPEDTVSPPQGRSWAG